MAYTKQVISHGSTLRILQRREEILQLTPVLEELALRCAQPGAMSWLPYFLHPRTAQKKLAHLVLVLRSGVRPNATLSVEDIRAAALFFEYRVLGLRTGAFATDDISGFRTVVAVESERASMTAIAVRGLMEDGAVLVMATSEGIMHRNDLARELAPLQEVSWARRPREMKRTLHLAGTLEETLEGMDKSTRFKLGHYRRRLQRSEQCEFVENLVEQISEEEIENLNFHSLSPVAEDEFRRRVCSASSPGGFMVGLRANSGQWLSLAGGWRQGEVAVLHWQLNVAGFERDSIGTAMRSFILEHEIARGTRRMVMYGANTHGMHYAFASETVCDLVARRRTLKARLLRNMAPMVANSTGALGRGNYLAQVVSSQDMRWHRTSGSSSGRSAGTKLHGGRISSATAVQRPD